MPKNRDINGFELIKILQSHGYKRDRQRGSHVVMKRENPKSMIVVPLHKKPLWPWLLGRILKDAGIESDQL